MPIAACLAALLLASALFGQASLAIQSAALQTQEDGASVAAGRLFRAGELAYGSFSVANFQKKPSADPASAETLISLSYRIEALDPTGLAFQAPQAGKLETTVRKEDKEWRPRVRFNLLLPPAAPSGAYRIQAVVKDEFAGKEARVEIPFQVKGYDVAATDKLTIANFRFQRTDRASEGAWSPATYRVGETVWVLFDATGFQLGPKNRYDVAYSLGVLDSAGKVLFEQDAVAELTEEPEYPKRGLPGALSIRVAEGTPKAAFQFRLRVTDRVGAQTIEHVETFNVE